MTMLMKLIAQFLVDLLNCWTVVVASASSSAWEALPAHSSWHVGHSSHTSAGHATFTASSVEFHHDGVGNRFKLLLLCLILFLGGGLVIVKPSNGLVNFSLQLLLVRGIKLLVNLGVGHGVLE